MVTPFFCSGTDALTCVKVVRGQSNTPVAHARVFILTATGQEISEAFTDSAGIAYISSEQPSIARYVMAQDLPIAINGVPWRGPGRYFLEICGGATP